MPPCECCRNNNDENSDAGNEDEDETPEMKLEREKLRRQQNNARERQANYNLFHYVYLNTYPFINNYVKANQFEIRVRSLSHAQYK